MNIVNSLFPIFFFMTFSIVMISFVLVFARGIKEYFHNNRSPIILCDAKVIAKRHHRAVSRKHYHNQYYVTFELESLDRIELLVDGNDYGLMIEGDEGRLRFQGTRFLEFERIES